MTIVTILRVELPVDYVIETCHCKLYYLYFVHLRGSLRLCAYIVLT